MLRREQQEIPVSSIDLGFRFRQDDDDSVDDLVTDIRERGIITPITVISKGALSQERIEELGGLDEGKPYLLAAGGRRTRAASIVGIDNIPAQIYNHDLDELELRIIELHENLLRKNLEFTDEIKLKAKIHELRVTKYGAKISTSPEATGVSIRDTAEVLGISPTIMSQDVRLAAALDQHPELADAKNKTDALKKFDEIVKKEARAELAKRERDKQPLTATQIRRKDLLKSFIVGNFFDNIGKVDDGIAQIVEIDPPYGIDLTKIKREGKTEDYNEIDAHFYEDFMRKTFAEAYRVMAKHSWLICWFGPDPWFDPLAGWIEDAGFDIRRLPGVWTKRTGQTMQPSRYLASASEYFFYARKGDPGLNRPGRINVFEYAPVASSKKVHPTERPIEMMEDLLTTFGRPGSTVMVPFAGSGNTLLAAHNKGMPCFGYDLSQVYKDAYDVRVMTGEVLKWKSY